MAAGIERSIRRLDGALDALEAVCGRLVGAPIGDDGGRPSAGEDRERLAAELGEARDRAEALEQANQQAAHRLARAMEAIRSVLDADAGRA